MFIITFNHRLGKESGYLSFNSYYNTILKNSFY